MSAPSSSAPTTAAENLSDAEQQILTAAVNGAFVELSTGDAVDDDPAGDNRDASRQIRASLLADLLTGALRPDGKTPRAIKLRGAQIIGALDLEAATLACPLLLHRCRIDEPVNLNEAAGPAIRMPGCHLPGLTATQLRTAGNLDLNAARFMMPSEVRLDGARIGGSLDLSGATFTNPGGTALNADGLAVEGAMLCGHGFTATGEVRLEGAHIGRHLDLDGATFTNPGGTALTADRLTVDQSMACGEGFTATGEIRLLGAQISGGDRMVAVKCGAG